MKVLITPAISEILLLDAKKEVRLIAKNGTRYAGNTKIALILIENMLTI